MTAGVANSTRTRATTSSSSRRVASPHTRTTNSSPPNRPTMSASATARSSRCAVAHSRIVAGRVSQRVVRRLEIVDVDEQDRQQPVTLRRDEGFVDPAQHRSAVGQLGQFVVGGPEHQFIGCRPLFGDVRERQQHVGLPGQTRVEQSAARHQPPALPVRPGYPEHLVEVRHAGAQHGQSRAQVGRDVHALGIVERELPSEREEVAAQVLGSGADDPHRRRVDRLDAPVLVRDDDAVGHRLHYRFEVLLRAVQSGQVAAHEHIAVLHYGGGDAHVESRASGGVVGGVQDAAGRDDCARVHVGTDQGGDGEAERLVDGSTVDGLGRRIPAGDKSGFRGCDDGVADVIDQRRLVPHGGFRRMSRADVSGDDLIGDLVLPHRHHDYDFDRQQAAVQPNHLRRVHGSAVADVPQLGNTRKHLGDRFGCHELGNAAPDDLIARTSEHQPHSGIVDVENTPILVHADPVGIVLHKSAVSILGQPQTGLPMFSAYQFSLSCDSAKLPGADDRDNRDTQFVIRHGTRLMPHHRANRVQ